MNLLDQVPIWRTLTTLPRRVKELEARVDALEGKETRETSPTACPTCGAAMHVTAESADPTFGTFGVKQRTLTCGDCGETVKRQWEPGKGYGL